MKKRALISRVCLGLAFAGIVLAALQAFLLMSLSGLFDTAPGHSIEAKDLSDLHLLCSGLLLLSCLSACVSGALVFSIKSIAGCLRNFENSFQTLKSTLAPQVQVSSPQTLLAELEKSAATLSIELVEAKKKVKAVIEKAVDVICIIDVESRFVSVGPACQAAWGYDPAELEGKPILDFIQTVETDQILQTVLGAAKSIARVVFECKLRKKNGDLIDIVWTGYWSASDAGLFSIIHDITQRKEAEEKIKSSEASLRLTLESLPAGVLIFSPDNGQIDFANTEAASLFRIEKKQVEQLNVAKLFETEIAKVELALPGDDLPASGSAHQSIALRTDGSKFPVEVSLNALELSGKQKCLVVFLDKTEQHELERLKGEFMAMIIHDIRSPLNSVSCMLDLLDTSGNDEKQQRIARIRRNANQSIGQIVRLINDLIDLEKIKSGKFEIDCTDVDISDVIKQAVESLQGSIEEKNLKIDYRELEDGLCWGDHERLVQVMVNLLSNACKYAPENSSIVLGVSATKEDRLKVTVSDEGPGIAANKLSKVFEKFEQADSEAGRSGGKGLGLAICKAIVEEHGGQIGVDSTPGQGSSFWFSIRRSPP